MTSDWTDADVELVIRALADAHRRAWGDPPDTAGRAILGEFAHAALSALAAAGRDYTAGIAEGRRLAAEEIAAARRAGDGLALPWPHRHTEEETP